MKYDTKYGITAKTIGTPDSSAGPADHERALLDDLLLFRMNSGDRKRTISELFGRFSSLRKIIYAPRRLILAATKQGAIAHEELQKARKLAIVLARVEIGDRPVLAHYDDLVDYCRTILAGEPREHLHVLFLDKADKLISADCLATGTIDHVTVYPREIFDLAMAYSAASVILVHNHPSGEPVPSRADIVMTRRLATVGHYLGISLCDHLIIGSTGTYSFRQQDELGLGSAPIPVLNRPPIMNAGPLSDITREHPSREFPGFPEPGREAR